MFNHYVVRGSRRLLLRFSLALACVVLGVAVPAGSQGGPAHASTTWLISGNYPRIAHYGGYSSSWQAPLFSRYGLAITLDNFALDNLSALKALRSAMSGGVILGYDVTNLVRYTDQNVYGTNAIYPGWWALKAGTTITSAINASQTTVTVSNPAVIHVCDDVMVGSESMHVKAISGKTLTVIRGFYSTAASHAAGTRIATHDSVPLGGANSNPSNCDPSNPSDQRPWLLNMSTLCPRNPAGQRWIDYLATWVDTKILSTGLFDGMFFDNTPDQIYDPTLDVNNDNVADEGFVGGVNTWQQGIATLFSEVRSLHPGVILMGDDYRWPNYDAANGLDFLMPTRLMNPITYGQAMVTYQTSQTAATAPQISIIHPATASGSWSLQLMRLGITTSLMGNGAFNYDKGAGQMGTPWWFDEYDDGAGTALTSSITASQTQIPVVHSNKFQVGNIVAIEGELAKVTAVGSGSLTVERGVNGTHRDAHPAGSVVATLQQIQQGLGYLGQPTDAAYPVQTTTTNLVSNGGFDTGSLTPWRLNVNRSASATLSLDTSTKESGAASAKIVTKAVADNGLSAQAVQLTHPGVSLTGGQSYMLQFWAKSSSEHFAHVQVCAQSCFADSYMGVRPTWTEYQLTFAMPKSATVQLEFALGDAINTTWIDSVSLVRVPVPVERRDFTKGTVLVNGGTASHTVTLPSGYCHLKGDQNPSLNNGAAVTTVTVPAQDGMILVKC